MDVALDFPEIDWPDANVVNHSLIQMVSTSSGSARARRC